MVLPVKDVNWGKLREKILGQESFIDKYGDECKEVSLGDVAELTPSGKHRDFGREARKPDLPGSYIRYAKVSEVPARDDGAWQEDSDWWDDLNKKGREHGIYIRPSDKDRATIMAGIIIRDREES